MEILVDEFTVSSFGRRCIILVDQRTECASRPQILAEHAIPWRNNDRDRTQRLGLAGETNQRIRFSAVDIAELFYLFIFTRADRREFFSTTQNPNPTSSAGRRATLNRNWSFNAPRIDRAPVTRMILGRAP